MPSINRHLFVPYTAAEMYALVDMIEDYPKFLPWCAASEVHRRTDDEVHATLNLSKGGIHKSFTTRNHLQKNKMIEMRLINGPFHHLEGFWRFESIGEDAAKVMFDMEFEVAGKFLSLLIEPFFMQIADSMVDAFHQRAIEVYGKRNL